MRRFTTALASLLSLLMVSASASASTCDLSCWLARAHSDCHAVASDPSARAMTTMDMPGMNMDSQPNGAASQQHLRAKFHHAMLGETDAAFEPYQVTPLLASRTAIEHKHSRSLKSCTHGACAQISTATSPPQADPAPPAFLHGVSIRPTGLPPVSNGMRPGIFPPRTSTGDGLSPILRI